MAGEFEIEIITYQPESIIVTRAAEDIAVTVIRDLTPPVVEITGVIEGPKGDNAVSDQQIEDTVLEVLEENDPFEGISDLATLYRLAKSGG